MPSNRKIRVGREKTPPTTPGNFTATAVSASQIDLSWDASTDASGILGYLVERDGVPVGGLLQSLSYSDTGLSAGTLYNYTVRAVDAWRNESAAASANATTQAAQPGTWGRTDLGTYTEHSLAKPAALGSITDPNFGATVKRLIAPATVSTTRLRPWYSNLQAWNADHSLLMLLGQDFPCVLDAATHAVRVSLLRDQDGERFVRWSPRDPYVLYFVTAGGAYSTLTLGKYTLNPVTWGVTRTNLKTWAGFVNADADGTSEMVVGPDGKLRIMLLSRRTSDNKWFAWAHNVDDGTDHAMVDLGALPGSGPTRYPETYLTPNGDQMMFLWGSVGAGRTNGMELFNLDGTFVRQITTLGGHQDSLKDSSGVQWVVMLDGGNNRIFKARIDSASTVNMLQMPWPGVADGIHISARHSTALTGATGQHVVVSKETASGAAPGAFLREVWLCYLDSTLATPNVLRLCHTRSIGTDYDDDQPHATIDRAGRKIVFGSNWGTTPKEAYEVKTGPSTAIESAAAALSSKQWSGVNPIGTTDANASVAYSSKYGRSPFKCYWDNGAGIDSALDWSGKAMYDPWAQKLWFAGGGTNTSGTNPGGMTLTAYDLRADTFTPYQGTTQASAGLWYPKSEAHCFDAADIDFARRKIYRAIWTLTGAQYGKAIGTFNVDAPSASGNPYSAVTGADIYGGAAVFPARNAFVALRKYGAALQFDLDTLADKGDLTLPGGQLMEAPLAIHHAGYVYFSQGTQGTNFYRLGPTGNPAVFGVLPVKMTMNYKISEFGCLWAALNGYLYAFHSNGNIYRCTLSTGAWEAYSDIPSGVQADSVGKGGDDGAIYRATVGAIPLDSGGAFLWVTSNTTSKCHLWKP